MIMKKTKKISFEENYKKLQDIATTLRNNQFMDLDQLLPMIKEATHAYENCKSRLERIKDTLNKYFEEQK
jgi:exodeoxyribonuclease VII small subunit